MNVAKRILWSFTPWLLGVSVAVPSSGQEAAGASNISPTVVIKQAASPAGANPSAEHDQAALAEAVNPSSSKLPFQLGLNLGGYYDDNIYIQPNGPGKVSDYIWTVQPVVSWNSSGETGLENSVQLSYAPAFLFYQDHPGNNTVDQSALGLYAYHGGKSDLVVSQQYISVQNSSPDLGDLVKYSEYLTQANLDYLLTGKISLAVRATQDVISYEQGFDSKEWTGSLYADYQALPKTSFGLGTVLGFADLEGPNQTYEQINGRVIYNPTSKISLNATAGAEFRQTQGTGSSELNPDFSIGLSYDPFDGTNLGLNAYRRFEYSAKFFGNDYLATGVAVSFSQRFLHQFYTVLAASYENASYRNNFTGASSDLDYDFFSVRPSIHFKPTEWCELGIFYQYRENVSQTIGNFTENQVGFQARFTY